MIRSSDTIFKICMTHDRVKRRWPKYVILEAFYPLVLLVHFLIVRHISSTIFQIGERSWRYYIYSTSMLYNTTRPFAILIVIPGFGFSPFTVLVHLSSIISLLQTAFLPKKTVLTFVIHKAFYLYVLLVHFLIVQHIFSSFLLWCRALVEGLYSTSSFHLLCVTLD